MDVKKLINCCWIVRFKWWKNKSNEEKMNTLWFWFRLFILVSIFNASMEILKNLIILGYL